MNPAELKPGESGTINLDIYIYIFSHFFVEAIYQKSVHISLLFKPTLHLATYSQPECMRYSKHAGHDSILPFEHKFFQNKRWVKVGYIPALIGKKSIRIPETGPS